MPSLLLQVCDIIRLIFIVANGQILKNNLTIWSHWTLSKAYEITPWMHFWLILAPAFLQTAAALITDGLHTEHLVLVQCFSCSGYQVAMHTYFQALGGRAWK